MTCRDTQQISTAYNHLSFAAQTSNESSVLKPYISSPPTLRTCIPLQLENRVGGAVGRDDGRPRDDAAQQRRQRPQVGVEALAGHLLQRDHGRQQAQPAVLVGLRTRGEDGAIRKGECEAGACSGSRVHKRAQARASAQILT